jgi:NAD(P)-dependent dehydrogenase (short-subunit alcohol dehydrogenase family)
VICVVVVVFSAVFVHFPSFKANVVVLQIDQSQFRSVRSFAEEVKKRIPQNQLKALVLNAGIWANQNLSEDSIPLTSQVNHYSGFLLSSLLLSHMDQQQGRIVIVSSLMCRNAVDFSNDFLLEDPSLLEGRGLKKKKKNDTFRFFLIQT